MMRGPIMPCGFLGAALFFMPWRLCLTLCSFVLFIFCGVACAEVKGAYAGQGSGIIFDERTVTRGQAQRILSVPSASKRDEQGTVQMPIQDSAQSYSAPSQTKIPNALTPIERVPNAQDVPHARVFHEQGRHTENLLDSMDVYALSPHAAQLFLPRMIPPSAVQQWYASHGPEHVGEQQSTRQDGQSRLGFAMADWDAIIQHASQTSGLDATLIAAVIGVESDFDAYAVSSKGAQGAMQIMPTTQEELGLEDAFNPHESVEAGSRYLRQQLDRFGSVELALAAYNAGPGNVERYGGIPPFKETQNYVRKVMALYARLGQ